MTSVYVIASEVGPLKVGAAGNPPGHTTDRVEAIVAGFSTDDRDALAAAFGNRVWGEPRREADPRGCEIQDRLTRTGAFRI